MGEVSEVSCTSAGSLGQFLTDVDSSGVSGRFEPIRAPLLALRSPNEPPENGDA